MLCRATTHTDLELRARALNIPTKVIHNASIMNAVGACGLQLYRFGEVRPIAHIVTSACKACTPEGSLKLVLLSTTSGRLQRKL